MSEPWFSSIKSVILDMDGVLWRGDQQIGVLSDIFLKINNMKLSVVLATNNSTLSAEQYIRKLARYGVNLELWQVVNSSQATGHYLERKISAGGPIYIIGEDGLTKTLNEFGFYHSESKPMAVVVGLDRQITYEKLRVGTLHVRAGAPLIATNPDKTFPTPEGLVPGAGAIIASLEASTGVSAQITGKPSPEMYLVALGRLNKEADETLIVGDRLETDIAGAQAIGCRTALVLSGVTEKKNAAKWLPKPDIIAIDLDSVLSVLNSKDEF
jgi:4-nitrophenyl phosphatase